MEGQNRKSNSWKPKMDLNFFFALLGGLLVLAFIANRMVRFTRVPDVIILMLTGVLIGPVLHWVNPDLFRGVTRGFGALALLLILFESGLDLKLRDVVNNLAGGFFLSVVGYALSMFAVAAVSLRMQQFGWRHALLVGAVLGCVSSSIVLPVLQQVKLRRDMRMTLLVEAALGDAVAVLAVTSLLDIAAGANASAREIVWSLGSSLVLGLAAGILAGMAWSYLLPFLSDQRFWHVLTFGAVLLVYAGVHLIQGNNLVGVLVFGITLANFPSLRRQYAPDESSSRSVWSFQNAQNHPPGNPDEQQQHLEMHSFHAELAFLIRTFFFVLLGVRLNFQAFRYGAAFAVACFVVLIAARWIAVQSGSFLWKGFSRLEREIMVWFLPRGLITAVLGIQVFDALGAEYRFLPDLAFAVILLTNVVLLVGAIRARRLPLPEAEPAKAVAD